MIATVVGPIPEPPRYSLLDGVLPLEENGGYRTPSPSSSISHTESLPPPPPPQHEEGHTRRPPRYSSVFNRTRTEQREQRHRTRPPHGSSSASHRYSTHPGVSSPNSMRNRSGPQLHEYHMRNGNGTRTTPFATLRVYSRTSAAGTGAVRVPKYVGADLVQGSFDLNLETPMNINSITLSLRGRIITSAYDGGSHTFLEHPITSWTRGHGDPRAMLLTPLLDSNTSRPKKFEGKLSGTYSWPFSFAFPQHAITPGVTNVYENAAPQTFTEKDMKVSVQYELVLRMTHGILRSDSKLHAHVVYVPALAPPKQTTSTLRNIAYGAGMGMPSPDVDPLGWTVVGQTMVQGRIFKERSVKLQCTVSLANPQSYTRGAVIPCHITVEGTDIQALDVLATPQTLCLRLVRRVTYHDHSATGTAAANSSTSAIVEDIAEVERAVWWVNAHATGRATSHYSKGGAVSSVARRVLEGEIHLEKELQPSCFFALFRVSYTVELLPFATPVFQLTKIIDSGNSSPSSSKYPQVNSKTPGSSTSAPSPVLISHPITIATLPGEGPKPVAHTTPKARATKTRIQVQARTNAGYEYEYAPGASVRVIAGVGVYI